MRGPDLQYVDNMRVSQSYLGHETGYWYVTSANDWVVHGPFKTREQAQADLDKIRKEAYAEAAAEEAENLG